MKFMMTFHWAPDTQQRAEAIERFQQTGGADFGGGFDLLETDDAAKLTEFAYQWSDLMELEITPVLEDAELAGVLGRVVK